MLVFLRAFFLSIQFIMIDVLSGVWHYKESFPEGFSTGYLIVKQENDDFIITLHGAEYSLGDKPFYFVESFEFIKSKDQMMFQGTSVYGLFEDQEYFLDNWLIVNYSEKNIIAESIDEQGANGAVVLTKI